MHIFAYRGEGAATYPPSTPTVPPWYSPSTPLVLPHYPHGARRHIAALLHDLMERERQEARGIKLGVRVRGRVRVRVRVS